MVNQIVIFNTIKKNKKQKNTATETPVWSLLHKNKRTIRRKEEHSLYL
jgi:hypothetical protein